MTIDEAVARFLADLEVGRSIATVATYRSVLRRFAEFLDECTPRPAALDELTAEHPIAFTRWISDHGRTPRATVQLYATAATRLYAFLVREGLRPEGRPLSGLRELPADLVRPRPSDHRAGCMCLPEDVGAESDGDGPV